MGETRILPKIPMRSTGISNVQQVTSNNPTTAGNNATSPISASPGASQQAQDQVISARNPQGAAGRPQIQGTAAPIQRRMVHITAGGGSASRDAQRPTVEILGRAGSQVAQPAQAQVPAAAPASVGQVGHAGVTQVTQVAQAPTGDITPRFKLDQAMLVASLLEKYEERAAGTKDHRSVATSRGALSQLRAAYRAAQGATAPTPADGAPVDPQGGAEGHLVVPESPTGTDVAGAAPTVVTHTSTVVLGSAPSHLPALAPQAPGA